MPLAMRQHPGALTVERRLSAMNIYYIYAYIRIDGTPYYIGKGTGRRAWDKSHSVKVPTHNRVIIMETGLTEIGAYALERRYIQWWGRRDLGTGILRNMSDGGEGRTGFSEESRRKLSESAKRRRPYDPDHSHMMSEMLRKRWSDPEFRAKMSERHTGRPKSEEHRRKIGESQKGKMVPKETCDKLSEAVKETYKNGRTANKGMLGKKLSPEERERCRQAVLKRWANAKNRANHVDSEQ